MRITLLTIISTLLLSSCQKDENNEVIYTVNCGSCDLTYSNATEDTEQRTVSGGWSYKFDAKRDQFLYISAQNNASSGSVSVSINARGKTIDSASSSGAYVIATASGSMP